MKLLPFTAFASMGFDIPPLSLLEQNLEFPGRKKEIRIMVFPSSKDYYVP